MCLLLIFPDFKQIHSTRANAWNDMSRFNPTSVLTYLCVGT